MTAARTEQMLDLAKEIGSRPRTESRKESISK
jgi:hypothetical protein